MNHHSSELEALLSGNRAARARAISRIENERAGAKELWQAARKHCGRAHIIGFTGAPGAGKSTLIAALLQEYLRRGQRVAVLAVDPSSPVTGGSLLGDRVRMGEIASDAVFIRSVSARGHLGGLSRSAGRIIDLFDAAGFDLVIVETVGTGQSEVEIAGLADTRVVICPPGLGDEVQAIKAGVLEIADILVVSKADQPTAAKTLLDLRVHFAGRRQGAWAVQVLPVVALQGAGLTELVEAMAAHAEVAGRGRRLAVADAWPARPCAMPLVLVGATRFARALGPIAAAAGFEVLLVEPRLAPARWPALAGVRVTGENCAAAIARAAGDKACAVVVCTRQRELLESALRATANLPGGALVLPAGRGSERALAALPPSTRGARRQVLPPGDAALTLGERALLVLAGLVAARQAR